MKLNAKQLRNLPERNTIKGGKRIPLYFILDNIYDTYNIGGLFRLADALNCAKIYLCGETETPPNHKIKKASVGTYKVVPWEYLPSVKAAITVLRNQTKHETQNIRYKQSLSVIALEQHKKAIPYTKHKFKLPLAFIIGNETYGISSDGLKLADTIVEIPMHGVNKSLNVIVAAGIIGYHCLGPGPTRARP